MNVPEIFTAPRNRLVAGIGAVLAVLAAVKLLAGQWVQMRAAVPGVPVEILLGLVVVTLVLGGHLWSRARLRRLLQIKPRRLRGVDPFKVGVTSSELANTYQLPGELRPFYVPRGIDERVLKGLQAGTRLVLLHGQSKAGKTRTAFEIAVEHFAEHRILIPRVVTPDGTPALRQLLDPDGLLPRLRRRYLLWLDDLADHLDAGGLQPGALEAWLARNPKCLAIATVNSPDLRRLSKVDNPTSRDAQVLINRAARILVPSELSRAERGIASERYTGLDARALGRLPEHLSAGPLLIDRWHEAVRERPLAAGLVAAVVHWRRAGLRRGCPLDFMVAVSDLWAPGRLRGRRADEEDLGWACESVADAIGLLEEIEPRMYTVSSDYLIAFLEEDDGPPVDERFVRRLVEHLREAPGDLLAIGQSLGSRGQLDLARWVLEIIERNGSAAERAQAVELMVQLSSSSSSQAASLLAQTREAIHGPAYDLPPTPHQRRSVRRLIARRHRARGRRPDGFDASLAPRTDRRVVQRYRFVLRRAVLRILLLVLVDVSSLAVGLGLVLVFKVLMGVQDWDMVASDLGDFMRFGGPLTPLVFQLFSLYRADAERARLPQMIGAIATIVVAVTLSQMLAGAQLNLGLTSLLTFAVAGTLDWMGRSGYDAISRRWVRRRRLHARVLLLGPPQLCRRLAPVLTQTSGRPMQIVGYLSSTRTADPYCVGRYEELEKAAHNLYIQRIIIVDSELSSDTKVALAQRAHATALGVELIAGDSEIVLGLAGRADGEIALIPVAPLLPPPEARALKRAFDVVVTSALLIPVLIVIALWAIYVKLRDPFEPVLVRSQRLGRAGISFDMLRLRTRHHTGGGEPEPPIRRLESLVELCGLDEVAQVFNVLSGDMSLVGPRPLERREWEALPDAHRLRLVALPGITGPWQLSRRRTLSDHHLLRLDLQYLRTWRVTLDAAILINTFAAVIQRGWLGDTRIKRRRQRAIAGQRAMPGPETGTHRL